MSFAGRLTSIGIGLWIAAATAHAAERPNIVFILTDNLGYGDIGAYGGGAVRNAPTPRVDQLAVEGMRLTNLNVEPECTPARSALMTGRLPIQRARCPHGVLMSQNRVRKPKRGRASMAGRTGLEPATSGVTGPVWYQLQLSGIV